MFERNVFVLNDSEYKQDIDPINEYIYQTAYFINKNTNAPMNECLEFVRNKLKTLKTIVNPKVTYLERNVVGDREKKTISLSSYIYDGIKNNRIFAPTLTTYYHPDQKRSFSAGVVVKNIATRYVEKEAYFKALADNNKELAVIKDGEQTNYKLMNNSFSGAFCTPTNVFYNRTAHNTLTSVTRTTASIANANNEKLITGNRHYWAMFIVYNNITSIISHSDLNEIKRVVEKYNLKYPTPEDTLECILYSTKLYWSSSHFEIEVLKYLKTLQPEELAAFVYTGDLYQLRRLNPEFTFNLITKLSKKHNEVVDNPLDIVEKIPEDILNLAHQICNTDVKGLGKKYKIMNEKGILNTLVSTSINVYNTLVEYSDIIKIFLVTNNIPASVAYFPKSMRRSAITSDTDSTIFTVQDWIYWYFGKYIVDDESIAVSAVLVFFASNTIYHILAILSSNFNYEKKELHTLEMKNEFRFDVFIPTQVAKHYYAQIGCREGNVLSDYIDEIKGAHLKNSNLPENITKAAKLLMEKIMSTTISNQKISLMEIINDIITIENSIYDSLIRGESNFYRSFRLKRPDSYKLEAAKSPYIYHMLWKEIFQPKYGELPEPPYSCIKVSTNLHNKTALADFVNEIEDLNIKERFINFLQTYNKTSLNTIMISKTYVNEHGLPSEIIGAINFKRIILDICNIFYIILETIGYYKNPLFTLREIYK